MTYPNIKDNDFQEKINDKFDKYKITKNKMTYDEYCGKQKYKLQPQQILLSRYINPKTPYKNILIFHEIGSGKTCTAIRICEEWKKTHTIIVILPASLIDNFKNELRSECGEQNYISRNDFNKLQKMDPQDDEYKKIINISNKAIDKYYKIYSYNMFLKSIQENAISNKKILFVVDEVQNIVSKDGTYYNAIYEYIKKLDEKSRIVLMSATPIFDKPNEIALTLNLLKLDNELPIGKYFDDEYISIKTHNDNVYYNTKNISNFKKYIRGHISYFKGAPEYTFPKMTIKYVKCKMSDFQLNAYKEFLKNNNINKNNMYDLSNNFYIGSRMISNIIFPNKKINESGYNMLSNDIIQKKLNKYSTKFDTIMHKINKTSGKIFVYSNFKGFGGLTSFMKILDAFGYKNYLHHGIGLKRYAVWSGDINMQIRENIKFVFNKIDNLKGQNIKILLGSPSIKEGVSLKAIRQVHIIEPYWNISRMKQIIGRASRFCSHKDLFEEQRSVKVYIYKATHDINTIDDYIHHIAIQKEKIINKFEKTLKESAIDCFLFKNANIDEKNKYTCDK
jgi:hypothetical protein